MTEFQLNLIDIITTPDSEYERTTEVLNEEEFDLFESILGELED